jgi:hypothetical protein
MKAILIQWKGPTNTRGSRFILSAEGVKSRTYPLDYGANDLGRRTYVADFIAAQGWAGRIHMGVLPNSDYVAVFEE